MKSPAPTVASPAKPVIISYCATFLLREMKCFYRQITGITRYDHWVATRTRAHAADFPYPQLRVLRKSPWRGFRRLHYRLRGGAPSMMGNEVRQVLELAVARQARLLHVYLGTEALRALPLLTRFPSARIVSFHGMDLAHNLGPDEYARLWPQVELVLFRSESLGRELVARGCPAHKLRLNLTGVPIPESIPPRALLPERPGPLRLLQVCRLIPKKGLDVSLRAVRVLKNAGVRVQLVIAGGGPEEMPLRNLASELGLMDAVSFAGFVTGAELERLFCESDLFLHPSRETETGDREGIPNALLEAMAWGLPVIATRHSGIPEAVTDGHDGLLIDACEPEALAAAVCRAAHDGTFHGQLSARARRTVEDRFSIARCVAALEASYHEAMMLRAATS